MKNTITCEVDGKCYKLVAAEANKSGCSTCVGSTDDYNLCKRLGDCAVDSPREFYWLEVNKDLEVAQNVSQSVSQKDTKQLLAEVTRELEYALAELWYHRRVSMSSSEFDKEYKGMLQVAKEANLHLQTTGIATDI